MHPMTLFRAALPAVFLATTGVAQTHQTDDNNASVLVRAHLESMVRDGEVPGIQYMVVSADNVLFETAVGMADIAAGRSMTLDTRMMAYSITKVVTAVAVIQLVEAGRIELGASLTRYFPDHPYGDEVTIRSLLSHTSGVPSPLPTNWFFLEQTPFDRDAALRGVLDDNPSLKFPPGTKYSYSNLGYWLLEQVIEAASGQDYADYVIESVFGRIGIGADQISFEMPQPGKLSTGYTRRFSAMTMLLRLMSPKRFWSDAPAEEGWARMERVYNWGRGYGGIYCTAGALAALLRDLLREKPAVMSDQARQQFLTEQLDLDGEPIGMTLGPKLGKYGTIPYLGRPGGGLGFHGNIRLYPEAGVATVMIVNMTDISENSINSRSDELDAYFITETSESAE
jgi:D-alanyl-D-alanine carboxypeptidase